MDFFDFTTSAESNDPHVRAKGGDLGLQDDLYLVHDWDSTATGATGRIVRFEVVDPGVHDAEMSDPSTIANNGDLGFDGL